MQVSINKTKIVNYNSKIKFGSYAHRDENLMMNLHALMASGAQEIQELLANNPLYDVSGDILNLSSAIFDIKSSMNHPERFNFDHVENHLQQLKEHACNVRVKYIEEQRRIEEKRQAEHRQQLSNEVITYYDMQSKACESLAGYLLNFTLQTQLVSQHDMKEFFGTEKEAEDKRKKLSPECQATSKVLREAVQSLKAIKDPVLMLITANFMQDYDVQCTMPQKQQEEMVDGIKSVLSTVIRNTDLTKYDSDDRNSILLMVQNIEHANSLNFGIEKQLKALVDRLKNGSTIMNTKITADVEKDKIKEGASRIPFGGIGMTYVQCPTFQNNKKTDVNKV